MNSDTFIYFVRENEARREAEVGLGKMDSRALRWGDHAVGGFLMSNDSEASQEPGMPSLDIQHWSHAFIIKTLIFQMKISETIQQFEMISLKLPNPHQWNSSCMCLCGLESRSSPVKRAVCYFLSLTGGPGTTGTEGSARRTRRPWTKCLFLYNFIIIVIIIVTEFPGGSHPRD